MNKYGWKEIQSRFYAATGFWHDRPQFGNRYRQLRGLWQFIQQLRTDSGLGRRPDGSVVATEAWWRANTMGHPEWKKLQSGWPIYLDELDRMFMGVAIDGSSSYVPGDEDPVDVTPNDEEEDSEDDHSLQTPQSTGSKRTRDSSQSLRSTATSPNKKTKSPAVRAMVSQMQLHNEIQTQRNAAMEGFMTKRLQVKQAEEAKMEKQFDTIMEAARDCGVTEDNAQLWIGVLKIAQDKGASYFFLRSLPHGRKALIEHYARVVD
ncbi:hypothetical protein PAHAL_3G268100 [Panicum hallii]|uniref:Uncharacterized protein n=1 Tax=Panicum hallii TaxID=206008 RepID=A0A2T8KJM4_9POAL|nr:hypothetical protein PAHAL_3G268100 [Panicum hallii]